jgi:hypothetical protein
MWNRALLVGLAVVTSLAAVPSAATASANGFEVTSTLDGMSVLPHRLHWLAYPSLPFAQFAEVDFVVDGTVRWVEHRAPYAYAADDAGRNKGISSPPGSRPDSTGSRYAP